MELPEGQSTLPSMGILGNFNFSIYVSDTPFLNFKFQNCQNFQRVFEFAQKKTGVS
jgi:hypothetical protein